MKTIEKIRQKIEELYDGEAPAHDQQCEFEDGYFTGIATISRFLDSLQEETPTDLEEAAGEFVGYDMDCDELRDHEVGIAAFIAGAEWQARQPLQGAPMPEDTVLFNRGVAEGRRLEREDMMKEAVEGEVGYWNQRGLSILLDKSLEKLGYDENTKVKLIIVKDK